MGKTDKLLEKLKTTEGSVETMGVAMNMLEYEGYLGSVEYSPDDHCLFGKLAYISDLVTYEASDVQTLEHEFREAVNDYLETCGELSKKPDKPFKGTFNIRVSPELHRAAVLVSGKKSLNAFVSQAIQEKVESLQSTV